MKTRYKHLVIILAFLASTFMAGPSLVAQTWTSLSGNQTSISIAAGTTKYYRLTGDVAMKGAFTVSGTLYLDLNGHVLKRSDHGNALISVAATGTITISDSQPNVPHYGIPKTISVYDDSFDYLWDYDASYTASTPNAIEIKGGIITGGIGQTGGACYCRGTFNLTGGTIAGNFVYCAPYKERDASDNWVVKVQHPWKFVHNFGDGMNNYTGEAGTIDFNTLYERATKKTTPYGCYVVLNSDTPPTPTGFYNIKGEGGALWFTPGSTFNMSGGRICYNFAAFHGGGVFTSGEFNMTGGLIDHNYTMLGHGGGVFINRGEGGKQFECDLAGLVTPAGIMVMNGGEISSNTAWGGSGGGIMAWYNDATDTEPNLTVKNGTLRNNVVLGSRTDGFGGGGAIYGEHCHIVIENIEVHGNSAKFGGGLYQWGRTNLEMDRGTCNFTGNTARFCGGALCLRDPSLVSAVFGSGVVVENNKVTEIDGDGLGDGGGLYTKGQSIIVDGATFRNNEAKEGKGGGIYLDGSTTIILKGTTKITGNTAGDEGGGVYIGDGTDATKTMELQVGSYRVEANTVGAVPNNIYLPASKTIRVNGNINPQYVGIYTESDSPPIPVLTGSAAQLGNIYTGMINGTMNIFDDRQKYSAQYTTGDGILYFGSSPWSPLQKTTTSSDLHLVNGVYEISSIKELTAFLWYVNDIDTHANLDGGTSTHPGASGKLTADINMEGHYWVPIANYAGTFDGNGHVISGLTMVPTNVSTGRGMFGVNSSGTIENVILKDCYFGSTTTATTNYMGGIVSQNNASGKVGNNVVEGTFHASNSSCIMGGIAGSNAGTVHSSYATPTLEGYQMGGLVGVNSGNLLNSFTNPSFSSQTGNTAYMGGLVGVNTGTVENCYVRLQGTAPASNFGWLVGNNTGTVSYCYAPTGATPYKAAGSNPTAHGTYGSTSTPYLYNHRDNQVTLAAGPYTYVSNDASADKQMLIALNKWVTAENKKSTPRAVCSYWLRPTTKVINDDLPLLRMTGTNAVAATDNDAWLDYNQVNDLLTGYKAANQAICLYGNESSMATNYGISSSAKLYIDQEASLKPATTTTRIDGYTSQMLQTYVGEGGERWHNFSSPLKQSMIGISYSNNGTVSFSWAADPCGVQLSSNEDEALFPHNTPVSAFDLYSFYEPEYHWINFKRNSNSHWHENDHDVRIYYNGNGLNQNGNESCLVPGKGYLVSVDVDQLLQNYGELNNSTVTLYNVTKTDINEWAGRLGFNLLGNPYQSYLDFEAFISVNGTHLWSGSGDYTNTYAIYDSKEKSYVQYKNGVSYGAKTASQYIHPHQGFFIRKTASDNGGSNTSVTYNNDMRVVTLPGGTSSAFRGSVQPAYPLINFMLRDSEGYGDVAVLELGRDTDEGAEKMRLGECKGALSLGYDGTDYGVLFRTEVGDYQSLHFTAREEGTFTLAWEPMNGEFSELTLIDNIAGTRTDMLTSDSYVFEGNPDQYASRFKIVIGDYKDIEEHEAPEPVEGPTFAFQTGNALVVNGEGHLEIVDMLGRIVKTEELHGSQTIISMPQGVAGMYLLRLKDAEKSRTQKIVIG